MQTFDRTGWPCPVETVCKPTKCWHEPPTVIFPQSKEKKGGQYNLVVLVVNGPEGQPRGHSVPALHYQDPVGLTQTPLLCEIQAMRVGNGAGERLCTIQSVCHDPLVLELYQSPNSGLLTHGSLLKSAEDDDPDLILSDPPI